MRTATAPIRAAVLMLTAALAAPAAAAPPAISDADAGALQIADSAPETETAPSNWHYFAEPAVGLVGVRIADGGQVGAWRLSLGGEGQSQDWHGLRLHLADRLDDQGPPFAFGQRHALVNTFKEAYLSWQPTQRWSADLGRINVLRGVALGYNPTDYFRGGATRSIVSVDPTSLKENRLGAVMARSQWLWDGGAVNVIVSPKLAEHRNEASFSPDWGASNGRDRGLVTVSQRLYDNLNLSATLYQEASQSTQLGLNATALFGQSTIGFLEWSGGNSHSQLSAFTGDSDTSFHQRLASGATYTTPVNLSITLEYEYDSAAASRSDLDALLQASPQAYGQYFLYSASQRDLPTQHALFLYSAWKDAFVQHLDFNGFVRYNAVDHSRLHWIEARYHLSRTDIALQWQTNCGNFTSEFGGAPQSSVLQLLFRYFY